MSRSRMTKADLEEENNVLRACLAEARDLIDEALELDEDDERDEGEDDADDDDEDGEDDA